MSLYVKVFLRTPTGVHEARTEAIRGGKDSLVSWNERVVFQDSLIVPGSTLEFFVMDKDLISDDHVANGIVDLAGCGILVAGVANVSTIKLHYKGTPAGELRFETIFQ